ncbi:ISL3 family transposase [Lactococcus ileimucosae]|uniref:ISL3 family transposase n=1 Tax=Lactococcus ileimucosae TaxID=2941329 RepID=A0ABV4D4P9_9LACT
MTHSDSITLSLDLKASELVFPLENFIRYGFAKITGQHEAQIFTATYRPKTAVCPVCGVMKEARKVRAYSTSEVLLTPSGHRPRVLELTKAKYDCADCGGTFTPTPYFVVPRANISSSVKAAILLDFKVKMSMRDVARRYFVSPAFCWKILDQIPPKQRFRHLQKSSVLMNSKPLKMTTMVYADGLTHDILDILESRKHADLISYFLNFPRSERLKVKTIVMDMNASYPALLAIFPNAQLVIDGFHVIQQLSRAFNQLRVKEMKELKKLKGDNGKAYRKLSNTGDSCSSGTARSIIKTVSNSRFSGVNGGRRAEVIDALLSYSQKLQEAYMVYQNALDTFSNKQAEDFFEVIETLPESLPDAFKKSCRYLLKHKSAIRRGILSPYSNGPLGGKNNLCKLIKCIAFGFGRFDHLRKQILLQQILSKAN